MASLLACALFGLGSGSLGSPPCVMARRACAQHCAEPHMPAQCGTPFQGDRAASPRSVQGSATGFSAALLLLLLLLFYLSHAQLYIVQCTVKCILYTCISRKGEREKNTVVKQY